MKPKNNGRQLQVRISHDHHLMIARIRLRLGELEPGLQLYNFQIVERALDALGEKLGVTHSKILEHALELLAAEGIVAANMYLKENGHATLE